MKGKGKTRLVFGMLMKTVEEEGFRKKMETDKKYIVNIGLINQAYLAGADVYPIMPHATRAEIRHILRQVNGVVLPGGISNPVKPSPVPGDAGALIFTDYTNAVRIIMEEAKELNDAGHHFPVLGICLGFESMCCILTNDVNTFLPCEHCRNYNTNLKYTPEAASSRLLAAIPLDVRQRAGEEKCIFNSHGYTLSPERFVGYPQLTEMYNVICVCASDDDTFDCVGMIEAKHYPFYGFQFHLEYALKSYFARFLKAVSVRTNFTFATAFMAFMCSEAKKNDHCVAPEEEHKLVINTPGTVVTESFLEMKYHLWD
jgi:anthranilate/para-aminobenzoate synthase component II